MTTKDKLTKVQTKLAVWIAGATVVATRTNGIHAEETVVVKRGDSYAIYRGFTIGGDAHVSADKQDVTADEVIAFLLGGDDA